MNMNTVSSSIAAKRPLIVAVEGNIASGKSTFLDYCRTKKNMDVISEPVDELTNVGGVNVLVSVNSNSS